MNIKISKSTHSCAACGVDFQHLQNLTSTVKAAEGLLHREDYCKPCWKTEQNKAVYSVWGTIYHDAKVEEAGPPEVFSPLRQLFYEAAEEESRIEMAKAFLAAGLLRRQKVFRLIKESDESDGNVRITLYADRIGNRLIEVPDPQFSYAEMDKARTLLIARLQELEAAVAEGTEGNTSTDGEAVQTDTPPADGTVPDAEDSPVDAAATEGEADPATEIDPATREAVPAADDATAPEDGEVDPESVTGDDTDTSDAPVDTAEGDDDNDKNHPNERKEAVHAEA